MTSTAYTRWVLLKSAMFGAHIAKVAMYPCKSTNGGASLGPLTTTCVIPKRLGMLSSRYGTDHDFIAASYAARYAASPSGVLNGFGTDGLASGLASLIPDCAA